MAIVPRVAHACIGGLEELSFLNAITERIVVIAPILPAALPVIRA